MMRYSKRDCQTGTESTQPAKAFFQACAKAQPGPWILLVGGSSLGATRVRMAESVTRFDERPSPWSHIALVLDVDTLNPLSSTGLEVKLHPPASTGPERSYVSPFTLSDYADDAAYPNLCVVSLVEKIADKKTGTLAERIRKNAIRRSPAHEDRPMGPLLASWSSYVFDPARRTNPILENVPHPASAYLDFVFASSGVDLTPSASTPAISPEHLWATLRYFDHPTVSYVFSTRRLSNVPNTEALLSNDLAGDYEAYRLAARPKSP